MATPFVFREITKMEELSYAFRLRYQLYSQSRHRPFLRLNEQGVDIDAFDIHAKHFAIFREQELIGYIRAIFPRNNYTNPLVNCITKEFGSLISTPSDEDYPFLSYENVPESYFKFMKTLENNGDVLCEASRLVIHPSFQSLGVVKMLIESSLSTHILHHDCSWVVINCCPTHQRFYQRYGSKHIGENKGFTSKGCEVITLAVQTNPLKVEEPYRERLIELNRQYKQSGQIVMTV